MVCTLPSEHETKIDNTGTYDTFIRFIFFAIVLRDNLTMRMAPPFVGSASFTRAALRLNFFQIFSSTVFGDKIVSCCSALEIHVYVVCFC